MRTIVLAGLIASSLLGCGSDDAGGGGGGTTGGDQGSGGSGGSAPECAPVASPEVTDVSGRWAYRAVGSQLTKPQGLDPITTRIISVLLVEQQQSGDAITASGTYCDHYTEDPDASVHAVIPDSYRDVLEDVAREGTFAAVDGGRRYQLSRLYEVVGAELDDVAEDELPADPEDERVVDQDGDGRPGVTIRLTGIIDGELYVVERKWTEVDGVAVSPDRIEGKLRFVSEQSVLGADPSSIEGLLARATSLTDPEECNSTFQMVRVPDEADCAWIVEQAETLFD